MLRAAATLVTAAVAVCGAMLFVAAPVAAAHTRLVGSSPTADAAVTSPLRAVTLTFDEQVQERFVTVSVADPDGRTVSVGEPDVAGEVVRQRVEPFTSTGRYVVGWRVVSADGHPLSGRFAFRVRSGAVGSASPTTRTATGRTPSPTPTPQARDDRPFVERHLGHILLGGAVVAGGAAVVVWERRRRDD
ncbi:MAG: copper resistance protein CopC [Streptosporangiales bacterium]|nr:copper resistance protein CopC [Streptosporangiales bacterium]